MCWPGIHFGASNVSPTTHHLARSRRSEAFARAALLLQEQPTTGDRFCCRVGDELRSEVGQWPPRERRKGVDLPARPGTEWLVGGLVGGLVAELGTESVGAGQGLLPLSIHQPAHLEFLMASVWGTGSGPPPQPGLGVAVGWCRAPTPSEGALRPRGAPPTVREAGQGVGVSGSRAPKRLARGSGGRVAPHAKAGPARPGAGGVQGLAPGIHGPRPVRDKNPCRGGVIPSPPDTSADV